MQVGTRDIKLLSGEIEVLLEVGSPRRILKVTIESLLSVLERELSSVDLDGVLALLSSTSENTGKKVFYQVTTMD